jgi:hypothetical protein
MKWKKRHEAPREEFPGKKDGPYDLIRALTEELAHIGKLRKSSNSEFVQRLFVRQFGSSLDAYAFYFQDRARESAESEGVTFNEVEREALHIRPEDTDADRLKPAYQKSTKNLSFGITIFAKVRGVEPPCTDLPAEIAAAVRIRNRLTHPKRAIDLRLTAGELKIVAFGIQWLQQIASWGSQQEVAYIERVKRHIADSFEKVRQDHERDRLLAPRSD